MTSDDWVRYDGTNPPTEGKVLARNEYGSLWIDSGWEFGKIGHVVAYLPIPEYVEPTSRCPICGHPPYGRPAGAMYVYECHGSRDAGETHRFVRAADEPTARKWWNAGGE